MGDVQSASAALHSLRQAQRATACANMSPGCCAQQLIHEASTHCGWANQPGAVDVGVQCVRGLTACELAVAMDPELWWQVRLMHRLCRLVNMEVLCTVALQHLQLRAVLV